MIKTSLGLDNNEKLQNCNGLKDELVSSESFLQQYADASLVVLQGDKDQSVAEHQKSYILVTIGTFSWQIPIKVSFYACVIEKLSFENRLLSLNYKIGSGLLSEPIPGVVQDPDCGKTFEAFNLKDNSSDVIVFDPDAKTINVQTDDESLAGKKVKMRLGVQQEDTTSILRVRDLDVIVIF